MGNNETLDKEFKSLIDSARRLKFLSELIRIQVEARKAYNANKSLKINNSIPFQAVNQTQ